VDGIDAVADLFQVFLRLMDGKAARHLVGRPGSPQE
jgi:hypothetical protein